MLGELVEWWNDGDPPKPAPSSAHWQAELPPSLQEDYLGVVLFSPFSPRILSPPRAVPALSPCCSLPAELLVYLCSVNMPFADNQSCLAGSIKMKWGCSTYLGVEI